VAPLLRVADVHNVAVATNLAGAECLVRALIPERTLSARN
jgi:methylglyoxal synthase